ncbi:MAG: hypothetical protein ACE5FD_07230 [Anaerolineae bacterium]
MAKNRKRRAPRKNPPHQILKANGSGKKINWLQVAAITVGVIIVLSMLLSLVITPGSGHGF